MKNYKEVEYGCELLSILYLCSLKETKEDKEEENTKRDLTMFYSTYKFRIMQSDMEYIYTTAKEREKYHPDFAKEHRERIQKQQFFNSERDALEYALKLFKEKETRVQIWAEIEKEGDSYYLQKDRWIVTDDNFVKLSAEYIGMALMYDEGRIYKLVHDDADVDDVIAYY